MTSLCAPPVVWPPPQSKTGQPRGREWQSSLQKIYRWAVELVGFWTPEYLATKCAKVRAAQGTPLVLVVARALAVGESRELLVEVGGERIVWCGRHARVGDVMRKVEEVAR